MSENKEKRGIYNVSFNEKLATPIKSELELIEDAVISYIHDYTFYYVKGYHSERKDKGVSAEHIKLHLESGAEGELNERMLFKNPKVSLFYEAKELNKELELLLKQRNKDKEINSLLKQMKAKNIKLNKANQNILNKANQLSR